MGTTRLPSDGGIKQRVRKQKPTLDVFQALIAFGQVFIPPSSNISNKTVEVSA